jgi:carbon monoxide dehydrogenase subunit G
MELVNEFTVNRPIDQTWAVLTDVERIAPCMPGAQLEEIEGETYRGVVKVKVGPITAAFKGQAAFVERDDANHRAVLKGEGRDTGGKGNASALITARLESVSDAVTTCAVHTDLSITGKVAQFGRGAMADVSEKLMAQFATNLNTMLESESTSSASAHGAANGSSNGPSNGGAAEPAGAAASDGAAPAPPSASGTAASEAAGPEVGTPANSEANRVRKVAGPAAEPIDLLGTAGTPLLKRLLPLVGGLAVLLLVLRRRRRSS